MKRIMILAISAILVANVSAHEKKEFEGKQLSKEQRVEMEIQRLTDELMLSDKQAANFAVTFREYSQELDKLFGKNCPKSQGEDKAQLDDAAQDKQAKARFANLKKLSDIQASFYDKFRKDLSARQTAKVMHLNDSFGPKPCCGKCDKKDHKGHHGHHGPQAKKD